MISICREPDRLVHFGTGERFVSRPVCAFGWWSIGNRSELRGMQQQSFEKVADVGICKRWKKFHLCGVDRLLGEALDYCGVYCLARI